MNHNANHIVKAIVYERYGPPHLLEARDIEVPDVGENDVLVRVHAAAVNPSDWHRLTGTPYIARIEAGLRTPKRNIPGTDVAGTVAATGSAVTDLSPGDEVFGWTGGGACAEYVAVPAHQLIAKPDNVSFEHAAATGVAAFTALQALRDTGRLEPGQKVLINGASGGVGTFAIQIAKALGADVTAVCSTRNVETAESLGADRVIDYAKEDFTSTEQRYDLFIDIPGNRKLRACRSVLAPKGTYVLVGGSKARWLGPLPRVLSGLLRSLVSSQRFVAVLATETRDDLITFQTMLEDSTIKPVLDRTYPLAEAGKALDYLADGHTQGKIIICP